jgi:hypothetical protein
VSYCVGSFFLSGLRLSNSDASSDIRSELKFLLVKLYSLAKNIILKKFSPIAVRDILRGNNIEYVSFNASVRDDWQRLNFNI